MSRKIKIGILGVGNMGSTHARNIKADKCPEIEIAAVADLKPDRLEWVKNNISENIALFNTAEEMFDSGLIEACIIAVPHYDHPKYAMECMKRGIHVMLEKPAGVYTKQVIEMNEESKKHPEVVFGLMLNQRTNCVYRKMYELVHSGKYGNIRRTNWIITDWYRPQAYYNSGEWRATWSGEGGGVLLNQCPHNLDLWQWICGMPSKVDAHLSYGKWHDIEVEDDVTVYVEYPNGATGVFVTSTGDSKGTNRFEIQMDGAKLVATYDKLEVYEYDMPEPEFNKINDNMFAVLPGHEIDPMTDGENPQHVSVLNAWAGAILRGEKLIAHGTEGINGLTLSNAMHLSSWLDKTIEIESFDHDLFYEELMKRVATSKKKTDINEKCVENVAGTFGESRG